jgi:hypothetical protein
MKKFNCFFSSILYLTLISGVINVKTKDIIKSGSDVLSLALTESGNAFSQSQSVSNADRSVINIPDISSRPNSQNSDLVAALSQARSKSLTGDGDSLGNSISIANAARHEMNPSQFDNNQVAALAGAETNAQTQRGNSLAMSGSSASSSNLNYDTLGNTIQVNPAVQYSKGIFFNTNRKVNHCDVGGFGDIYCIGQDKRIYYYDILTENHILLKADYQLEGVVKIAVSNDGSVYAITLTGETFYYSCKNTWVRLDGCATDIAIGLYGEVFKIGCDVKNEGLGVYKLFCQGDSCFKACKRHRMDLLSNDFEDERSCSWFRVEGSGVAITVGPQGQPIVTRIDGSIWSYNGSDWDQMGSFNALDLCVSNDGTIYAVGNDRFVYKQKESIIDKTKKTKRYTYQRVNGIGNASVVACGPLNLPFIISGDTLWNAINTHYN